MRIKGDKGPKIFSTVFVIHNNLSINVVFVVKCLTEDMLGFHER